ncbi:MAG: class I SAM-dependent methyltransferase [Thermoplasmata archaeon]|nr:class I SAM-dependent methyltransferase [Thermoplasmata archaeon]
MKYYDTIAEGYNELYRDEQLAKLELIRDYLSANQALPQTADFMLDVGCGSGVSSEIFKCRIIGIDPSLELLKQANATEGMRGNCIQAIAEYLPFKNDFFKYTIAITSAQNFEDVEKGLSEIKRVSTGRIILTVPLRSPKLEQIQKMIDNKFKMLDIIKEDKDLIFCVKKI